MGATGEKVLEFIRSIPRGRVCTYGQLARKFGTSPRAVGSIMHANKNPVVVPCHRIVMSDGSLGGYSGGLDRKIALLQEEGVDTKGNIIDLKKYGWSP